jgi:hypothetical protein
MSGNRLLRAAEEVLSALEKAGIPACLIGALAVHRWGEARATRDVDVSVLAPYGEEGQVLDLLLTRFVPRRADARTFALDHRVLLLKSGSGPDIDVALAAFPFELEALEQSSAWEAAPGLHLRTCPAEHLIAYKLVAARPHDLVDMESIVRRQRDKLDVEQIRYWGRMLAELKEDSDLLRPFEELLRKLR